MLKKKMLLSLPFLLFLFGFSCISHALEVETHRAINEYIAQNTLNGWRRYRYHGLTLQAAAHDAARA